MKIMFYKRLKSTFNTHTLLFIYTLILLILVYGVIYISNYKHILKVSYFIISLYSFYVIFHKIKLRSILQNYFLNLNFNLSEKLKFYISSFIFLFTICTVLIHFYLLGGSPPIIGFSLETADDVAKLRRGITDNSSNLMNYISSFNIRAFIPFLIYYFYRTDKKIFYYIILFIGLFYGFSMMQKSYVLTILSPIFVFTLFQKKYFFSIKYIILSVVFILGLSYYANPEFRTKNENEIMLNENEILEDGATLNGDSPSKFKRIIIGLQERVLVIPGEMVSQWFDHIPENKPFLYGDGYRIMAKIKGNEFKNYSEELYPLIRPSFAERGLKGNVNSASFMYDYANFGIFGLILSGLILSLLFLFIEAFFGSDLKSKIAFNLFPLLIISSTALTTTLFSGGWGIILFLYGLLVKSFKNE